MIPSAMAVRHLRGGSAKGEAKELMPQADSKNGDSSRTKSANNARRIGDGVRIAGAVREKNAVRLLHQNSVRWSVGRNDGHSAIVLAEKAKNVSLDSVVVSHDVVACARISPAIALARGDA